MTSSCSIVLLESALTGTLSADEEASLHHHLEGCEACSTAIEQLAGGAMWRQEAAMLLTRDELDAAVPTHEEWSTVDFTVEHLEPSDEPHVLGQLGGYDILEVIGRGGMGIVLKGFDRELKRCVAIKVLAPHLAQSSLAKKRFAREAQAAAAVVHPHVLAIHQVQPSGRLPFLVMPLVAGESLAQRLAAQGTLELKEILRIGMQAAAGLAAAHEQGLIHRDVKPANILLEKGIERAVLTDFGLARAADDVALTRCGTIAGTPQYMSPEQAKGETLDGRSDLFSLGCVLYEMATGVSPFRTDSTIATLRRLIDEPPQALASLNPELPPWFIAIVERLLEKDPSQRFSSAKEVSDLLENCLAHVQQPSNVPLPAELRSFTTRRAARPRAVRWGTSIAAIVVLGASGVGAFFLLSAEPPDIAGQWSGEDWGKVVLKPINATEYTGTYSDTLSKQLGELQLKWSRIERRFNGTWREGENRFGELSVRQVGDEIRGAHTTDSKSKINPDTPHLADLVWVRSQSPGFGPVTERVMENIEQGTDYFLDLDTGDFKVPPKNVHEKLLIRFNGNISKTPDDLNLIDEWVRTSGADLMAGGSSLPDWLTLFGGFFSTPNTSIAPTLLTFDNATPEMVLRELKNTEKQLTDEGKQSPPFMSLSGSSGSTHLFQTGKGGRGLLQNLGKDTKTGGIRVRYKLVQTQGNSNAIMVSALNNARWVGAPPPACLPFPDTTFGPIVEGQINSFGNHEAENIDDIVNKDCSFDLDSGKAITPPRENARLYLNWADNKETKLQLARYLQSSGADILFTSKDYPTTPPSNGLKSDRIKFYNSYFVGVDGSTGPLDHHIADTAGKTFDNVTPSFVLDALQKAEAAFKLQDSFWPINGYGTWWEKGAKPVYFFKTGVMNHDGHCGVIQFLGKDEKTGYVKFRYKLLQRNPVPPGQPAADSTGEPASRATQRQTSNNVTPTVQARREPGSPLALPRGGAVRLHALGKIGKPPGIWWAPDGMPIKDKPYREIVVRHFPIGYVPDDDSCVALLEFDTQLGFPAFNFLGQQSEFKGPYYSSREIPESINGIVPPLYVGFDIGEWKKCADLTIDRAFKDGDFECSIEKIDPLDSHWIVSYSRNSCSKVDATIIPVDKGGKRGQVGILSAVNPMPRNSKCRWGYLLDIAPQDVDHFELMTVPRHWVSFSGFATAPDQLIEQDQLQAKNVSAEEIERIATGIAPLEATLEAATEPELRFLTRIIDGKIYAWKPDGNLVDQVEDISFMGFSLGRTRGTISNGLAVWVYHPLWKYDHTHQTRCQIRSSKTGKLLGSSNGLMDVDPHWFVFALQPEGDSELPGHADIRITNDTGSGEGIPFTFKNVSLDPDATQLAEVVSKQERSKLPQKTAELDSLSHRVPFEVGVTYFVGGDSITVDEVRGTSATMTAGNMYEIKGTYRLASQAKATLAAYVTVDSKDPKTPQFQNVPTQKTQSMEIDRGDGRFTLLLYMWQDGNPHISFYAGGESIAGVYFGTGNSVLRKGWWEDSKTVPDSNSDSTSTTQPAELPGIHARLLLSAETHSYEMMRKNIGYNGISILGTGAKGTVDGKKSDNITIVIAHKCRLESFKETQYLGKKYWDSTFFVPQDPTSDGSNRSLSQKRLDGMKEQRVEYQLDHYLGQVALEESVPTEEPRKSLPQASYVTQPTTTNLSQVPVRQFLTDEGVKTIACSADGKWIAIANGNPTFILQTNGSSRTKDNWKPSAKILDARTGKTVVSLKLATDEEDAVLTATERVSHFEVTALAFSPDGTVVAVGTSIGQIKLFNARTGELVRSLDDEPAKLADKETPESWKLLLRAMGSVASLGFSPDGSLLATCGRSFTDFSDVFDGDTRMGRFATGSGRLKVWEVNTGTLKHDLVGHSHANAVAFSPDGTLLASAGRWSSGRDDRTGVILWNPQAGEKIRAITTEANGGTHAVAFSPDGKLVAIGSVQFDKDKDHDAATGSVSLIRVGSGIMDWRQSFPGWAKPLAFSPDGKNVLVCSERMIRFLGTETGTIIELASQRRQWNFAITPQGDMAISGIDAEKHGFVEVWDLDGASTEAR